MCAYRSHDEYDCRKSSDCDANTNGTNHIHTQFQLSLHTIFSIYLFTFSFVLFELWNTKPIVIAIDLFVFCGFFNVNSVLCNRTISSVLGMLVSFLFQNLFSVICLEFARNAIGSWRSNERLKRKLYVSFVKS